MPGIMPVLRLRLKRRSVTPPSLIGLPIQFNVVVLLVSKAFDGNVYCLGVERSRTFDSCS